VVGGPFTSEGKFNVHGSALMIAAMPHND
jgi:hypothetical protein